MSEAELYPVEAKTIAEELIDFANLLERNYADDVTLDELDAISKELST